MNKAVAFFFAVLFFCQHTSAQNPVNWTPAQLLAPAELAKQLLAGKDIPVIFSVGPGAPIPHSIHVGMTNEPENVVALKKKLSSLSKKSAVVIYCGCCPFANCPNVRPAIDALKELQFTNYKLLDLPKNVKADWIGKGYPVVTQ